MNIQIIGYLNGVVFNRISKIIVFVRILPYSYFGYESCILVFKHISRSELFDAPLDLPL